MDDTVSSESTILSSTITTDTTNIVNTTIKTLANKIVDFENKGCPEWSKLCDLADRERGGSYVFFVLFGVILFIIILSLISCIICYFFLNTDDQRVNPPPQREYIIEERVVRIHRSPDKNKAVNKEEQPPPYSSTVERKQSDKKVSPKVSKAAQNENDSESTI